MKEEEEASRLARRIEEMIKTSFTTHNHRQLNDTTRQVFQQMIENVFDKALQDNAVSPEFRDLFEVTTYIDHSKNSLEARLTPKTAAAAELVLQYWIPGPCLIDVQDNRTPIEELHIYRTRRNQFALPALQEAVDGYIDILTVRDRPDWVLVVDEDAKLKKKMVNPTATFLYGDINDFIAGTVLFCPREMIG